MKRFALVGVGGCAALVLVGLLAPAPLGEWLLVFGAFAAPVPLMLVGSIRRDAVGPVGFLLAALLVVLVGAGLGMLWARGASLPWVLGLPFGAGLQLYLACVLPLLVAPLAYAAVFERHTLMSEDLERLRRRMSDPTPPD